MGSIADGSDHKDTDTYKNADDDYDNERKQNIVPESGDPSGLGALLDLRDLLVLRILSERDVRVCVRILFGHIGDNTVNAVRINEQRIKLCYELAHRLITSLGRLLHTFCNDRIKSLRDALHER